MAKRPFTEAEIEIMDQYWSKTNGGQVRIRYDKSGHSVFQSMVSLIIYLAERAEFREDFRQEFMDLLVPTHWLGIAAEHSDTPMLHNKLLVQRTAEKLRGI